MAINHPCSWGNHPNFFAKKQNPAAASGAPGDPPWQTFGAFAP